MNPRSLGNTEPNDFLKMGGSDVADFTKLIIALWITLLLRGPLGVTCEQSTYKT